MNLLASMLLLIGMVSAALAQAAAAPEVSPASARYGGFYPHANLLLECGLPNKVVKVPEDHWRCWR